MTAFNQPIDSSVMPRCSQPATLMRLPFVESARGLDIALFGVPFDLGSTNRNGPRLGPAQIRDMSRLIRRVNPTTGVNPYALANVADIGDAKINMMSLEESIDNITDFVTEATAEGAAPVAVGGDQAAPRSVLAHDNTSDLVRQRRRTHIPPWASHCTRDRAQGVHVACYGMHPVRRRALS